jgi:hypothetical protein
VTGIRVCTYGKFNYPGFYFSYIPKLTTAEVLAGMTFRAAYALNLEDRGILEQAKKQIL